MSVVINLLGGSGLGKSTTAALLFGELKLAEQDVELVQEYAKEWAWEGRRILSEHQDHIADEQHKREARLYGKVEFIITDSPLILGPVYQKFYSGADPIYSKIETLMNTAQQNGIVYKNFLLTRNKPFNPKGRFETEDQAKQVDAFLRAYLIEKNIPFIEISSTDRDRVSEILRHV